MNGLRGPTTVHGKLHKCNIALHVPSPALLPAGERLSAPAINPQHFSGDETTEPSVIGWMPSAQLYFRDGDGHSLEFIALLDEFPDPGFIGSLSEWKQRNHAR